jgi:hypothetical protein
LAGATGLIDAPDTQTTSALLEPAAQWTGYVSPPGYVALFSRFLSAVLAQLGGVGVTLPDYPAGPPFGWTVQMADGQLNVEVAAPARTLEDLAAFIKAASAL